MSASFASASSQYLLNNAPQITTYPFTVAMWLSPKTAAGTTFWNLGSATANQMFRMLITAGGQFQVSVISGGADQFTTGGAFVVNTWSFIVGRYISSTNRRMSILSNDGQTYHLQNTSNVTPTNIDAMLFGARKNGGAFGSFYDGKIGEAWYTNTDIQADGAQLQDSTLRQLAYGGPFSLPNIAKDIIEYRSFEDCLDSRQDRPGSVYYRGTRPVWTNTNGVTLGPHPPAAIWYDKPLPELGPMVIV